MKPSIWIRMPGVRSDTLAEILDHALKEKDLKEIHFRSYIDDSDGLLDSPMWIEITFFSVQTLLQLIGLLVAYKPIKISTSSDGKGAKTINKKTGKKELRTSVDELSARTNAATTNRSRHHNQNK